MLNKNRARTFSIFVLLACLVNSTVACEARSGNAAPAPANQNQGTAAPQKPEQTPETTSEKVPCTLHKDQSSDIGGLRLGLTTDQVLALFPGIKEDAELKPALAKPASPLGVTTWMVKPERYSSKDKFVGVREVLLTFLDGRLTTFQANYTSAPWKHVDEFVTKFTTGSNFPGVDSWDAYPGLDTQQKSLKCDGFEVTLFAGGENLDANYTKMQDLAAAQELKERRAKAKQQKATP